MNRRGASPWLAPVLGLVVLVIVGVVAFTVGQGVATPSAAQLNAQLPSASSPTPAPASLTDVARAAMSRTVTIEVARTSDEKFGTGWLFDSNGDFVTNAHVISGYIRIRIRDRNGNTHDATVLGEDDTGDVAVIRSTDGFAGDPLPTTTLQPPSGAQVVALASSRATGHGDATVESVSGADLDVPVKDNPDIDPSQVGQGLTTVYSDMVAISGAQIFPGNSGGPVLNSSGQVFGIVTLAGNTGDRGYAIPLGRVIGEIKTFAAKS